MKAKIGNRIETAKEIFRQMRVHTKSLVTRIVIVMVIGILFTGCGSYKEKKEEKVTSEEPLSIIVGTDLHYLSSSMTDYGEFFMKAMAAGDGKFTAYCEEITDAFLEEVKKAKPNALILSGDITFNGDENSHKDMVQRLLGVQDAGINVLVLPGNHDIDYPYVYKYEGDQAIRVEGISAQRFKELYRGFGYDQAVAKDKDSFSYVYKLADDFWVMFLDSHAKDYEGTIERQTLGWAEEQLQKAQEKGIKVITVTHENVLAHHESFTSGFVLNNSAKVLAMLEKYDVHLNLSGHIHMQHITKENNFCEVVTSALSVSPNQYGIVEIGEDREMTYKVRRTDVASYAQEKGSIDTVLLNFAEASRVYFNEAGKGKTKEVLSKLSLSQKEINDMTEFVTEVNEAYFAGTIIEKKEAFSNDDRWKLWEQQGQKTFFYEYLRGIIEETPKVDSFLEQKIVSIKQ